MKLHLSKQSRQIPRARARTMTKGGTTRPRFPLVWLLALAVLFSFNARCALAQTTALINDDMSSPNYSEFSFNGTESGFNPDDISTESSFAGSGTGNPGGSLEILHNHDVERDTSGNPINGNGETSVQSFFTLQTFSYTPSVEGAILSVTFSLDIRTSDPFDFLFFTISDSMGGTVGQFIPISGDGTYQTITSSVLINADFPGRDFAGSDPLFFGFGFLSTADVTNSPETFQVGADNFVVTATIVPEPSVLAIYLLGAGLLLFWQRRGLGKKV